MSTLKKDNNSKKDKPLNLEPILATFKDIRKIKDIGYYFWKKEGVYSDDFYISVLLQNLSFVYKIANDLIAVCLTRYCKYTGYVGIDLLCVKKEYQGKGLGKALLNYCIENCMKLGLKLFELHVATTNIPAYNLYKKLGFKNIKTIENYYFNDEPPDRDAYLMRLDKSNNNESKKEIGEIKTNERKPKKMILEDSKNQSYNNIKTYRNGQQYEDTDKNSKQINYNNYNYYSNNKNNYNNNVNNKIYTDVYKNNNKININNNYNKNNIDNNFDYSNDYNNNINNKIYIDVYKNNNKNNITNNYNNNKNNKIYDNHNNYNITDYRTGYWKRVNHKFSN